ncbi:MAG: hypothetical protein M1490_03500 [Candidatus Bathyarchaeota archaeon]|nr:hypothetical protein [Candidatus Bathyarchaeota archaeon]
MTRFLRNTELYETVLQKSLDAKEILWVCSSAVGLGVHRVFSQEILKNPPVDVRFVFPLNDFTVKDGEVNPYEIQYLMEHFKGISIKSHENFHSNTYIFDNSALITSATLTEAAFESNIEVGVLLEGSEAEDVKNFFNQNLWNTSKSIGELKKYKLMWNLAQKTTKKGSLKKAKTHTKIRDWTNDYINTWYIGVSNWLSAKSERKIKKETNWRTNLSVLGDVGYQAFMHLKLGDYAYLADFSKRGKIGVALVRITDKVRVETDEGDLHCAYEAEKNYSLDREQFYELLKNANIRSKTSETILNDDQLKHVANVLSSIKRKRKRKSD